MNQLPQLNPEPSDRDSFLPDISIAEVLREVFAKLRRRWHILAFALVAAVILSVLYVVNSTAQYTANGSILIDPRVGQSPDSGRQISPALLISDALTVDSELRVLTSREVTNSALKALQIKPAEPSGGGLRQQLMELLGLNASSEEDGPALSPGDRAARENEARRRNFVRGLQVQRAGDSFVIDLAYTSASPSFAALAVNTLMQEYLRQSSQQQISLVERNQTWLSGRIAELEIAVQDTETAIAEFRRANDLMAPAGQLLPTEVALNAAVENLVRLRSEALAVSVQAEQLAEQIADDRIDAVRLPEGGRNETLDEFEARFAELQQREKELLLSWSESATIVQTVRQQLEQIRELIRGEYRQALEQLQTRSESLNRQVAATEQVITGLREEYADDSRKAVELRSLEREADAKRELYERLLEEYNSGLQLLTFEAIPARVIAWAVPPDKKSAPKSQQVVVLAVFGSLVLAVATIFLIEALDGSLRSQAQIGRDLKLRFLGVVTTFKSEKEGQGPFWGLLPPILRRRSGRWRALKNEAWLVDFAARNPKSFVADTMRMLHTQLGMKHGQLAASQGSGLVIGFTSSVQNEGKTMTATNFAAFLAMRQEKVALIDMDMITCQMSRLMGPLLPKSNNLSKLLADAQTGVQALSPIPELPGLTVIGSVPSHVTPRNSKLIENALNELRQHYDYIIVDLPPAQGTADTQLLATLCDTLIYLVRWGSTPLEQVVSSLRGRGLDKSQIFGVLFTQAPIERYRAYNRHDLNKYYE